jgi:hypothetical protein
VDSPPTPEPRRRGNGTQTIPLLAHIQALLDERELRNREQLDRIIDQIGSVDRITDAKFVTFRTLIDSQAEKVALALAAADKAVSKAEVATEKRFEGVNEFRAALNDQTRLQVTTDKFDSVIDGLNGRIRSLETRIEKAEGQGLGARENKTGIYAAIAAAVGLLAIVVFVANMFAS